MIPIIEEISAVTTSKIKIFQPTSNRVTDRMAITIQIVDNMPKNNGKYLHLDNIFSNESIKASLLYVISLFAQIVPTLVSKTKIY